MGIVKTGAESFMSQSTLPPKIFQFVEAPAFSRFREDYLDDEGSENFNRAWPETPKPEISSREQEVFANSAGRTPDARRASEADFVLSTTASYRKKRYGYSLCTTKMKPPIWARKKKTTCDKHSKRNALLEKGGHTMSKPKAKKRNIFAELVEGLDAMKAHREGKLTLRTHKLQAPTVKEAPGAEYFVAVREKFNVSRPVWADMLRVSPRTVEKWEQGGQASPLAATFVELVSQYPDTIERLQTLSRPALRPAVSKAHKTRRAA